MILMNRTLILLLLLLGLISSAEAACDFTTSQNVTITPGGNHNAAAGYTQLYVLTDANGLIVATSTTGDFGTQNFGSYDAYALNYETANAPSQLPTIGVNINSINDGCAVFSAPLPLTVCETSVLTACEDSGDDIIVALSPDYNSAANFNQVIIIVNDVTGQIEFVSTANASTGTVNYTTSAAGDLPNGSYTVHTVNYENSETLASLGLTAGSAWTGNFGAACAQASTGTAIQVDLCTVVCGTCNTPDCLIAGPYPDYATAAGGPNHCSQINDLTATPINGTTFTSYHQLSSSANGTVGVVISVGVNAIVGGTPCPVTRVATLYPIGGPCDGTTAITFTTTTANGSPFYNPEWTGLTPNTDYVLEVTFTVPAGCEMVDHCESFYAPSCNNAIGTVTVTGGTNVGADEYDLTDCETIDFSVTGENLGEGVQYGWAVFNCAPTMPLTNVELQDLTSNPCYLGSDYGTNTSDVDAGGISGTIPGDNTQLWILPYISEAADQPDANNNGCYALGTPIQINYIPPTCGDCAAPTCAADNVGIFDDRTYNLCNDPCADLNNMTYVTYHTVTTDANGNVGVVQTVSAGCNVTRTAVLRDATNSCSATDIPANIANANGVGSGFNPEWTGLTPNTNYTLIITTVIPAGCNYDYACVDFYGTPQCGADAGTTTVLTSNNTNNDYVLCWGESIDFTTTGFVLPGINLTGNEAFGYAVYTDPMPGASPNNADAGFVEYLIGVGANASLTLTNDGSYTPPFINNLDQTLYFYPITMDDGLGQNHDVNGDNCFDVGPVITVTFLNEITTNVTQDCLNDASVYAIDGGYLEFFAGNYNVTNLGDGQLSSATVNTAGGNTSVTNLIPGSNHYIDILDDNGCALTTLPQLYPVDLFFDSINFTNPTCSYLCDGEVSIYANNATQFAINSDPLQANNVFSNICSGIITVTIEDNNCVVDSVITISAPTPVTIVNSADNIICIGATEPLTANASGGTGPNYDYYWDNTLGASLNNVSPIVATTYEVYALDANGCSSDTNQINITLLDPLSITTNNLDSICEGESINISTVGASGDGNYSYDWTNNDGTGWSETGANITVNPSSTTEYYLTLSDGCTTPDANETVTIIVNEIPDALFAADTLQGCYPLTVNFENLSTGNLSNNCTWTINGEVFNSCANQNYTFDQVGCYDVTLNIETVSGCASSNSEINYICVYDYPISYFEADNEVASIYNPLVNFINLSTDNYSNEWVVLATDTATTVDHNYYFPEIGGFYETCLTVTNQYGCNNTFCNEIEVKDEMTLYVPNAFTPDGDGDNDNFFVVINQDLLDEFELLIFNRWGELILKNTNPNAKWDGTYLSTPSPEDVYVWVVNYKTTLSAERITKRGHVSLIR